MTMLVSFYNFCNIFNIWCLEIILIFSWSPCWPENTIERTKPATVVTVYTVQRGEKTVFFVAAQRISVVFCFSFFLKKNPVYL